MRAFLLFLVVLALPAAAQGTISISSGAASLQNGARLETTGSVAVETGAALDASGGTLVFAGAAAQSLTIAEAPLVARGLEIDKSGGTLTVVDSVRVTGLLSLLTGTYDFPPSTVVLAAVTDAGAVQSLSAQRSAGAIRTGAPPVYERPYLDGAGWRMISTPFAVPFASLNDGFHTQGAVGADVEFGTPNLYVWNPIGTAGGEFVPVPDYSAPMEPGRGYVLFAYDAAPGQTGLLPATWDVAGDAHTGPITIPLYQASDGFEAQWALLGNPYASGIDWDAVRTAGRFQTAYTVWDPGANGGMGNYALYSSAGVSTGDVNGTIPAFQSFWAETSEATGMTPGSPAALTFDEAWRVFDESPLVVGRSADVAQLRFHMEGEGLEATEPVALFLDGGQAGPDPYDARRPAPLSQHYASVVFVRRDNDWLLFDGRPAEAGGQTLDLAVEATQTGTYTLTWPALDLAPVGPITLTDHVTGTTVDLRSADAYAFEIISSVAIRPENALGGTPSRSSGGARFSVHLGTAVNATDTPEAVEIRLASYPNPSRAHTEVVFDLPEARTVRIDVIDIMGRVATVVADGEHTAGEHRIRLATDVLSAGVYVLRLTAGSDTRTQRITVLH